MLILSTILKRLRSRPSTLRSRAPGLYPTPQRRYAGTKSYYDDRGYLRFRDSDKLVHRYIAEKKLGRKLDSWEVVHHIDGNKCNNSPANLEVYGNWEEHDAVHRKNQHVYGTWHQPKK